MPGATTHRGLIEPPRRSPLAVAVHLYREGGSFRGFFEFALIGAVVLWFLASGSSSSSLASLTSLFKSSSTSSASPPITGPTGNAGTVPKPDLPIAPRLADLKIEPNYFDGVDEPLRGKLVTS